MDHFNMLVIGSGPSGRRAAVQSAKLGKSVLVVDKGRRLGGVSVHTGTIPSKTLRETVLNLSGWRERGFYGRGYRVKQDISASDLIQRLQKTLDHEVEVLQHQFMRNTVRSLRAAARFVSQDRVSLEAESGEHSEATFDHALISVGTRPHRPDNIPFDRKRVFDSDEMLELDRLPRSLTVIGAGVIGVEYATIFSALDVPVTLVEPRPTILDFIDKEIVDDFIHQMRDRGMVVRLGTAVKEVMSKPDCAEVILADGRVIRSEIVLYAAGRTGNIGSLGLEVDRRRGGPARPHQGRSGVVPDQRAEYLCGGRCHRLSKSGFDLDGAGQGGRLPRLRRALAAAAGNLSLWHLRGAGNLHRRPVGGTGARRRHRL